MKTTLACLSALFCLSTFSAAQTQPSRSQELPVLRSDHNKNVLSFSYENFEGHQFPPPGWVLESSGTDYWSRSDGVSAYGLGSGSAMFDFWDAPKKTMQSLVLSSMGVSRAGDSLLFDYAYGATTSSSQVDSLYVEGSTDGGVSYAQLVKLWGGPNGSMVTAPTPGDYFVPTATQWKTKSLLLPTGTNRVRFRAVSAFVNNLYIDNCRIGSQMSVDVAPQSIDIPNPAWPLLQVPKATVKNLGPTPQSFTVTMLISPDGYTSTRTVTGLAANATSQLSFDGWTPAVGTHTITAFTTLAGDLDGTNDTLRVPIPVNPQPLTNISALFHDGQVFLTWDNLARKRVVYTAYRSPNPIRYGSQLASVQNLGTVSDNSGMNQRVTSMTGTSTYLKIDSASAPLASNRGLFVATSQAAGTYYYAITPKLGDLEDTTIIPSSNSLSTSVTENVMMPKPVWQGDVVVNKRTYNKYVLFATKVSSSIFPQMTTAGTFPYNLAIFKSGTVAPHPITFWLHPGGGDFLATWGGWRTIGDPNEWVVTLDEWLPGNGTTNSYGYHENYDVFADTHPIPTTGLLYNYTARKVAYIVDWALRNLPVDSTRTYMTGYSMGAMGTVLNSIALRQKIAAIFVFGAEFNMSVFEDGWMDPFWGTRQSNLMTNEGLRRDDRLNMNYMLSANRLNSLPIIFTFSGKNDVNTGWAEKLVFYDTMNACRHGGYHFWNMTDHFELFDNYPWSGAFPNFSFFTRYRTNLSYPAFSNCSVNKTPGNGTPLNGDTTGSINGHLDWGDNIVDLAGKWEITLVLKDFPRVPDASPDSATTDVTPRRLQAFSVPSGARVAWQNRRNGVIVQQSSLVYDGSLLTIAGVKVYKDSSKLTVTYAGATDVEQHDLPREFALSQNYPNPFNPTTHFGYRISDFGHVSLKVFDALGREIATLVDEVKAPGSYVITWDARNMSSGMYFYRLRSKGFVETKKMMLVK
jgi:hypothetical protein